MRNKELELCTAKEAAEILKLSTDTIYNYAREGRIKSFKLGNRLRIYVYSLKEEYLNAPRPQFS